MPGGPREAYERVRTILEESAAHVDGDPCVAYLGPGSAGHYVKMVHNGIEYGIMQLISETYDLMKRGLGMTDEQMRSVYSEWNAAELDAYLIEITANIFGASDQETGKRLLDEILDEAKQKGTGKWTSQDAMELQAPVPTIDAAVSMRDMSALKGEREDAAKVFPNVAKKLGDEASSFVAGLRDALYASMIITYAQGMAQLAMASKAYGYDLKLEDVARIWRGGCIIRSALLEPMRSAFGARPDLPNLLMDEHLGREVSDRLADLRRVVASGVQAAIAVPAMSASLAYFDSYRSAWLPANLIQAQRDYFGAHTYERVDEKGDFHTEWQGSSGE